MILYTINGRKLSLTKTRLTLHGSSTACHWSYAKLASFDGDCLYGGVTRQTNDCGLAKGFGQTFFISAPHNIIGCCEFSKKDFKTIMSACKAAVKAAKAKKRKRK